MTWSWKFLLDVGWLSILLALFAYFWHVRRQLRRLHHWQKTTGHIKTFAWTTYGHRPWPKIEYEYEVDGQVHTGEAFFFDTIHNSPNTGQARQLAYQITEAYKARRDIDVYYNPTNPTQAVLDTAIPTKLSLILYLIASLICLHLIISIFAP